MTHYQDIHQSWSVDYCDWNETIRVHISDALKQQIKSAREVLKQHNFIYSIDINVPPDFLHERDESRLQEQCCYDVQKLIVGKYSLFFEIQNEWDASYQAEYDVTRLVAE